VGVHDEKDELIDLVSSVSGEEFLKVDEDLGEGFVRLRISEAERRQAKHDIRSFEDVAVEMLRNARDAHAHRIFAATAREGSVRRLTMIDDGIGIPASLHERVFEPRVTSKLDTMTTDRWGVHGRGMALFSVKSNVSSAAVASSAPHKGASIEVVADTDALPERADQSTWPEVATEEDTLRATRGPHNIIRRAVEFACEHPAVDVYLGTPTEVLATLYGLARDARDERGVVFTEDAASLPVWQRPAAASDAQELVTIATGIGLDVSERTAHRILAGDLQPLEGVLEQVAFDEEQQPEDREMDIYRDRRSLRIHHSDLDEFKRDLLRAFDTLSERYYLNVKGEPRVTVGSDEIRVRFCIEKEE
jgi:hypothetical protein